MIYVYCVAAGKPDLGHMLHPDSQGLYAIEENGLFAIARSVSEDEFGEGYVEKNMADLGWVRAMVMEHEEVVEHVMKGNVLMPLRFGTIFESDDSLKRALSERHEMFSSTIEGFKEREEWGVKVYVEASKMKSTIETEDCEITELDREIGESSAGKAYFLRQRREDLVRKATEAKVFQCGDICFFLLSGESEKAKVNGLLPMKKLRTDSDIVLNAVFLVRKEEIPGFIGTVDYLQNRYGTLGFSFDCTGPWPPYNFCSAPGESVL